MAAPGLVGFAAARLEGVPMAQSWSDVSGRLDPCPGVAGPLVVFWGVARDGVVGTGLGFGGMGLAGRAAEAA